MEDRSSSPSPFFYRRRVQAYIVGRLGYCRAIHWWWILPRGFPPGLGSHLRLGGHAARLSFSLFLSLSLSRFPETGEVTAATCSSSSTSIALHDSFAIWYLAKRYVDAFDPRPVLAPVLGLPREPYSMIARFLWLLWIVGQRLLIGGVNFDTIYTNPD